MTKRWVRVAACAVLFSLLPPACREEKEQKSGNADNGGEVLPLPVDHLQPAEPEEALVREQILPLLADYPMVQLGELEMDTRAEKDGAVQIAARVLLRVQEDLYEAEENPGNFDEDLKQINQAMNQAMLPDAHFLLQVGAQADALTDEDRAVKPLPPELQRMVDEVQEIARRPLYRLRTPANTAVEVPLTMRAVEKDGQWSFSDTHFDTAPLKALQPLIAAQALPQGAAIYTAGFEAQVRAELQAKMTAFCTEAQTYIRSREQTARETLLRMQSSHEEAEKRAQQQEEAHAAWEKSCAGLLYDAALYEGEWKRGDSFGKFSLRISKGKVFPEGFQFVGTLSDTDLPQAEMQVTGRAEPAKPGEAIPCVVRIFNGRYDPDVPTAEVFDAKDALMRLSLAPDGTLSGVMTCESWGEAEADKVFQVQLHMVPPRQSDRHRR